MVSSPAYVPDGHAPELKNMLVHLPGQTAMRGSLRATSMPVTDIDWTGAPPIAVGGVWSAKVASTGATKTIISYLTAPLDPTTAARVAQEGQYGASLEYSFTDSAGALSGELVSAAVTVPGRRSTRSGGFVWGYASNLTSFGDGVNSTTLLGWDAASSDVLAAYVPSPDAAPRGGLDIAEFQSRLFVLGGYASDGGTTRQDSTLYYSVPGGPALGGDNDWKDPVSGIVNQITIGFGGSRSTGLANIGRALLIFQANSIYALTGTGQSTWQVKLVTDELGCVMGPTSIMSYDQGVFFMSRRGLMYYDSASFDHVSESVDHLIDPGKTVQLARMRDGYILVRATAREAVDASSPYSSSLLMYHTGARAWTRLTFDDGMAIDPLWIGTNADDEPFVITPKGYYVLSLITDPLQASARDYDRNDSYAVPAMVTSRQQELASPDKAATIQRVLVDCKAYTNYDGDPSDMGWWATLTDGRGRILMADTHLTTPYNSTMQLQQRVQMDAYAETNDAQLDIEWRPGTDPPTTVVYRAPSIYDAYIEYFTAQKRADS